MGLAFVDVSTGEFLTTEIPAERLHSELAKFRPAECIASNPIQWEGTSLQILEEACFSAENAATALENRFGPDWAQRFRLETKTSRSAGLRSHSLLSAQHSLRCTGALERYPVLLRFGVHGAG